MVDNSMIRIYSTKEVFVPGGTPDATYNPRQEINVELEIEKYLEESGKALSIYGASKCGKTVLTKRLIPENSNIWLHGQEIESDNEFWAQIAMRLGEATSTVSVVGAEKASNSGVDGKLNLGIAEAGGNTSITDTVSNSEQATYHQHAADAVRAILPSSGKTLVIDDFHFIPDSAKNSIAKAIKTLIPNVPVVLIAVPSEAFDVVKDVPNMEGRVWSLKIPEWSASELSKIAEDGFPLLNVVDKEGHVAAELARFSYGSPFIMQQLCFNFARWTLNIRETGAEPIEAKLPSDFQGMLSDLADKIAPSIFPKLLDGPNPKGRERDGIHIKPEGYITDIYGAVLLALKNLVPPMNLLERAVSNEVQRISRENVVSGRVTSALNQMSKISFDRRGDSDPVLVARDQAVYIQDSVLAFYLRHSNWTAIKRDMGSPT